MNGSLTALIGFDCCWPRPHGFRRKIVQRIQPTGHLRRAVRARRRHHRIGAAGAEAGAAAGKPFVVDNRPGGGGVTAATAVAQAAPDGYTIMMASSTILAINVTVRKNLAYDPRKDLTPIALLARVPFVLVVNPSLPIQSVADLVKLAKDKPGR
jgi:hypothetical protein